MKRTLLMSLLGVALLGGCGDDTPHTPAQAAKKVLSESAAAVIGTPAPDFVLTSLAQQAWPSAKLLPGKVTLLHFWAPWCPPCVEELPELARLHMSLQGQNAQVMAIALAEAGEVQSFLAQHPLPFPVALGGDAGFALTRTLGNAYAVLPYSVVIDADGIIRAIHAGPLDAPHALALLKPILRR